MARSTAWLLRLTVAGGLVAAPAHAQSLDRVDDAPAASAAPASRSEAGAASRFVNDVMRDYRSFVSMDTAKHLGPAGVGAMAVHAADQSLRERFADRDSNPWPGGNTYGLFAVQLPAAFGWWMAGAFPSGHASTSFATAVILQRHYGWKVGVPAFAAAVYTAASRVTAAKHWASDVAFGAALGMQSARVVTIRLRDKPVSMAPVAVPGGGAVMFTVRAEP